MYEYRFQNRMKNLSRALSKSLLYLHIKNENSTLFRTSGTFFKVKITPNITAALFTQVMVCVVKSMSVNPSEMSFQDRLNMKIHISNQNQLNT